MNPQLEQLHDIDGIDVISAWPISFSLWLVFIGLFLVLVLACVIVIRKILFHRSWKNDTLKKLQRLEQDLSEETSRESVIALSEYVRRIAVKQYSREECAGLMGQSWLKWLKEKDAKAFDWEVKGIPLVEIPYAPTYMSASVSEVKELIQAIRSWVR